MTAAQSSHLRIEDRLVADSGRHYLPGLQALVRLPIAQSRRDRSTGLNIGTFITGYPGSPLAGYDLALDRAKDVLKTEGILHVPAANEEMAAGALIGTQMIDDHPRGGHDGVVGFWYGKGPGVDRAGDALKHGNFAGTSRHGAVVILDGADHEAKSSTVPYQDDYAFMSAGIPVLFPATVGEFVTMGLHAVAMSRYSGCWVSLKLTAPLCDGGEVVALGGDVEPVLPELGIDGRPFEKRTDFSFFPGRTVEIERQLYSERHEAVRAYAVANGLDRVEVSTGRDRVGIVTAGKSFADTRQALTDMGIGDRELQEAGIRVLRLAMTYPIDRSVVREFGEGLEEIIVIEEKRGVIEGQVKEALFTRNRPVTVVGKLDEQERPLFPAHGGFDQDLIAERLGPRLAPLLADARGVRARLAEIAAVRTRDYESHHVRTPNFCSGCPHSTSTRLVEGQVAWGSPGCHAFNSIIAQPERHIETMTHYGGEGLPWVGLSPFTERAHLVQNLGDGALFHSAYLNIRFCVATGVNITFKILYNGSIANTGAQEAVGGRTVPELTQLLSAERVARVALVTKTPAAYRRGDLAPMTTVHDVDELDDVSRQLAGTGGVTILIYDESCANERRRKQKRGMLPKPNEFIVINEDVCENCGHCGALTNCMSLQKVDTELGEKTQVHASSCNQDYFCLKGDCPSFVTVHTTPGTGYARPTAPTIGSDELVEPAEKVRLDEPYHIYIPGVGGTGVITLNALLCFAAAMDGADVMSFDQTGAAQKWGPVLSSLTIAPPNAPVHSNRIGVAKADLYLALDEVGSVTPANLDRCDPGTTVAVLNTTLFPTGEMIRDVWSRPDSAAMRASLARVTRSEQSISVEARRFAEALFGDYMMTNMVALGSAYQAGLLPLSAESIEAAIRLNGVAVENNTQAFRWGRMWILDPDRVTQAVTPAKRDVDADRQAALASLSVGDFRAHESAMARVRALDEETTRLLSTRVAKLIAYQDPDYAARYIDFVVDVAEREQIMDPARYEITHAVSRSLYQLMAYKDEYEVARLLLADAFRTQVDGLFDEPVKLVYNLHPPILRSLGMTRKVRFGPWATPALRALKGMRRVRGTRADLFGLARHRREERALIDWYTGLLTDALEKLRPANHALVVQLAELPGRIRGYDEIKSEAIRRARTDADDLVARIDKPRIPLTADGHGSVDRVPGPVTGT